MVLETSYLSPPVVENRRISLLQPPFEYVRPVLALDPPFVHGLVEQVQYPAEVCHDLPWHGGYFGVCIFISFHVKPLSGVIMDIRRETPAVKSPARFNIYEG